VPEAYARRVSGLALPSAPAPRPDRHPGQYCLVSLDGGGNRQGRLRVVGQHLGHTAGAVPAVCRQTSRDYTPVAQRRSAAVNELRGIVAAKDSGSSGETKGISRGRDTGKPVDSKWATQTGQSRHLRFGPCLAWRAILLPKLVRTAVLAGNLRDRDGSAISGGQRVPGG